MRIEIIHPLLVHFPLALLLTGAALRLLTYYFEKRLLFTSWVVLGLGVCFAWFAVLAGEFAADIVEPNLCDPGVLDQHSLFAYTAASFFTAILLLDWSNAYWLHKKFVALLCPILFLGSALVLIYVGYLGGSMVYEQGAAVKKCCRPNSSSQPPLK